MKNPHKEQKILVLIILKQHLKKGAEVGFPGSYSDSCSMAALLAAREQHFSKFRMVNMSSSGLMLSSMFCMAGL